MSYEPGLNVGPGNDTNQIDARGGFDSGATIDTNPPGPGVDTPDPFGAAAQAQQYSPEAANDGIDVAVDYLPPWPITQAPGTKRTIAAGEIIPIDPWSPVIAMLNSEQLALLNRQSAMRQAAGYYVDSPREI